MRKALAVSVIAIMAAATFIGSMLFSPQDSLAQGAGRTPPPDRPGNNDTACPPGNINANGSYTKAQTNDPKDKDVNGDGRSDYFMGEWKFVDGANDLIVREWCINNPPSRQDDPNTPRDETIYQDFFTQEIITSLNGVETLRVAAGTPT